MDEMPKHGRRRSFHLTPERVLLGLPSLWGVLFVLEQFQRLGKGYSVLLALASMGMIVLVLLLWFTAALVFRWRFQFSLRTLCFVMLLACIGMSWLGVEMQKARRQKEVVEEIEKVGGYVVYAYQVDATGSQIRIVIGDNDFFANVIEVCLDNTQVTDSDLECLKGLTHLQELHLKCTQVTDQGVKKLQQALPNCQIVR
ncbi:MAG: hypothetical protein ACLQNE_36270 [Thermoguttaceae bacterium]